MRAEAYYDTRFDVWNRNRLMTGAQFQLQRRFLLLRELAAQASNLGSLLHEAERQPLATASYSCCGRVSHAPFLSSEISLPWNTDRST